MEYEIKPKEKLSLGLQELWQYRELFYFFTWRDIKVKYKQTVLGFAWAIFQPLIMTLVFTLFLGKAIADHSELPLPYPIFVLSGMLLWSVFSNGLSNAANSMVNNANIIKKIYFPRLIIPLSAILVSLFDFLMGFLVFIPALFYYHVSMSWTAIYLLPIALLITVLASFGLGTLLAALNIKYRDFRYILPFFIQAFLFITPIIYPANISQNNIVHWVMRLNPMSAAVETFRAAFLPHYHFGTDFWISFGIVVLVFLSGLIYFRKTEYYFADLA